MVGSVQCGTPKTQKTRFCPMLWPVGSRWWVSHNETFWILSCAKPIHLKASWPFPPRRCEREICNWLLWFDEQSLFGWSWMAPCCARSSHWHGRTNQFHMPPGFCVHMKFYCPIPGIMMRINLSWGLASVVGELSFSVLGHMDRTAW